MSFCDEHGTADYCGECVYGPEIERLTAERDAAQAEARNWKRIAEDATHVEREELSRLREAGSRAAEIIRREAESIRDAHKARGVDWTGSHGAEARAMYDEMMAVVAALSQPATEQPTDCGNCHEGTTEFGHRCPQCEGAGKQPAELPAEICPNCDGQLPEGCRGTFSSEPECRGHYQQLAERESETVAQLRARLWNAIPDLPPADRRVAESLAEAEEWTPKQRRAAYALLRKIETTAR